MADANTVSVRIRDREFRIRGDGDADELQRIAGYLDETMSRVEQRTGTVDTLDVALLTALNLAREVLEARQGGRPVAASGADAKRLRSIIELAESAVSHGASR